MAKKKVTAFEKVDIDRTSLQQKLRRDPRSYADEFMRQWNAFEGQRETFLFSPSTASSAVVQEFHDLVDLLAHVLDCFQTIYPAQTREFPDNLKAILTKNHATLNSDLREKIVGSLVLLRRKDMIDSSYLLTTLFPILVSSPSKTLRTLIFQKILSDLRTSNSKSTNHPLNRTVQAVLYNLVTADRSSPKALWAVKITREMWKRQIWTDAKPVDVMKEACLSDNEKVAVSAGRFFLGGDKEREEMEDDSSDEEAMDIKKIQHQAVINKKTKKKAKAYEKAIDKVKRAEKKKHKPHPLNFSAFHLLHDPQDFAEKVFYKHLHGKCKFKLESKLVLLQLVTRLIGMHKLTIITLYSWFVKYLTPRQQQVTSYLAFLAQATHELVPPDAIEPLVVKIANEFVSEASAGEVAAAGLNAIREICVRQPLAMSETLLQDLVQYRKSKDKGVMMAAKGLLSLYREVGAELLKKRDRGKDAAMGLRSGDLKQRKFGETEEGGIEGLELLEKWKEEQRKRKREEEENGENGEGTIKIKDGDDDDDDEYNSSDWEVESADSDDSGGWIDVSHSEDEGEKPVAKKRKTAGEALDVDDEKENNIAEPLRMSKLATTSILTPADLAKLQELRMEANVEKEMGHRTKRQKEVEARHLDEGLTAEQIEAPAKLRKTTKEERVAMAKEGKANREEHKSTQALRQAKKVAEGKSSTNREKARKKNFLMTLGKAKTKQKRSLVQARNILRGHVERSKRGGRRGNGM